MVPFRLRLFKERITLSTGEITIRWIVYFVLLSFIRWIVIYPVDSVLHPLNNRVLLYILDRYQNFHGLNFCSLHQTVLNGQMQEP